MVPDGFHDFFVATAGATGALIGLLFVAISVTPEKVIGEAAEILQQTRASSALTAFIAPLVLSLAALIPGTNIGWVALVVGIPALLYVAGALRRMVGARQREHSVWRTLTLLGGFAVLMVFIVINGVRLLVDEHASGAVSSLAALMIASLAIGVDRAWELVGARSRSLSSSLRDLVRGDDPKDNGGAVS